MSHRNSKRIESLECLRKSDAERRIGWENSVLNRTAEFLNKNYLIRLAGRQGFPANSFSSFHHDSLLFAKSFVQCKLRQTCFFVRLLLVAGCCDLCRHDDTRNVTR
jgi:hypothetical protein